MVAPMTTPILLPLFPLPNVLLLPETTLPLHVFEPRYRTMLSDALAGDRVIVSKSGIGDGQRAGLYEPPEIGTSIGGLTPRVKWWKELK